MQHTKRNISLREAIKAQMVLQRKNDLRFVPEKTLKQLLGKEETTKVLEILNSEKLLKIDVSTLTSFVCEKATRIFAILAWSEEERLIEQFYEHRFGDEHLPIEYAWDSQNDACISWKSGNGNLINDHPFNKGGYWNDRNLEHFCSHDQWPFLSPVFSESQFCYTFHESIRMPFVDFCARSQKESLFSVVQERLIHRDHLQASSYIYIPDDSDGHPCVAVKELKQMSLSDEDFEKAASTEVAALKLIRDLNHAHLIRAIAYYKKGTKHCVMFPWARHGNLRDFWNKEPPELSKDYLKWVFTQLVGLAGAIKALHHSHPEQATRHGDLKPENILCFDAKRDSGQENNNYILVIADVGLSKSHDKLTELRNEATRTNSGTIMYEPPETELQPGEPRSRRYDVWSLGCIYLEFIIWLLYGTQELNHFRQDLSVLGKHTRFYVIEEVNGTQDKIARLNTVAEKWINWIRKDRRCPEETAVRKLLELVVTHLLVADVSGTSKSIPYRLSTIHRQDSTPTSPDPSLPYIKVESPPAANKLESSSSLSTRSRATAQEMYDELSKILKETISTTKKPLKWMIHGLPQQQGPRQYGHLLDSSDRRNAHGIENEYPLDDHWKYTPDTEIAETLFSDASLCANLGQGIPSPRLCHRCRNLEIWVSECVFPDTLTALHERSSHCDLCRLLLRRISDRVAGKSPKIQFIRVGSSLALNDRHSPPILSIYDSPSHTNSGSRRPKSDLQIGFPKLHDAGTSTHIKVLAGWVRSCDQTHPCYPKQESFLPTRILDVGTSDSATVRLFCGTRGQTKPERYLALSHRWGPPSEHQKCCTYNGNIEQHQRNMQVADLPKTFQDAINITRALSIRYLWIDSICIIQDDAQDWEMESKLMEQIFSSAYITLAASCASGTDDGFLKPRPHRECMLMKRNDTSYFYICDAIDDFSRDVDQGELNTRGWVLQERALSRRTIHFTENQTYWECGEGVRCETLTRLKNKRASFLGDANFPHSVKDYVKGMKIELFQGLYERYSQLALSFNADRPIAIRGLEKRLIRTFKTTGGYGIFDCYFQRCLLWQRAGDSLKRIGFSRGERIPSWSWMAYTGRIEYMDVPFGEVAWSQDIQSPFKTYERDTPEHKEEKQKPFEITAQAWGMVDYHKADLVLDDADCVFSDSMRCVILGTAKATKPSQQQKYYTLIITSVPGEAADVYERVGVGVVEEAQIARDKSTKMARIV